MSGTVGLSFSSPTAAPGLGSVEDARPFYLFWRADRSRSRDTGGCGLGLAVFRAIVEGHEGRTIARPRQRGGMIFGFSLPPLPGSDSDGS